MVYGLSMADRRYRFQSLLPFRILDSVQEKDLTTHSDMANPCEFSNFWKIFSSSNPSLPKTAF